MSRKTPEDQSPNAIEMLLTRLILRAGEQTIATNLGLSPATVCRKVNGSEGWSLNQLGRLLPMLDLKLVESDDEEQAALKLLALKYLEQK